ncbi:MAG: YicC family protein [Proteobacteria bacterium]|nr:YicC family protein [Pseudomonadota bacterium]
MIASMTGFARREIAGPWGTLACELRSVNHRFLEAGFRLPEELRAQEAALRQTLGKSVKRGKVDCSVHWRPAADGAAELDVDDAALARVIARLKQVTRELPAGGTISAVDVLRWPGVVRAAAIDTDAIAATLNQLFQQTLAELVTTRRNEGARLFALLEERCDGLEALVAQVRARLPEIEARVRARLAERVGELAASVDPARLEQEVVLLLQRLDIAEELDRLTGHLEEIRKVIGSSDAAGAGRRLDFLMQELNREANTLASKSQDLETTRMSVDMKVLIEQLREQVQNVE